MLHPIKLFIGRYILPKIIFKELLKQKPGKGGEIPHNRCYSVFNKK